MNFVFVTLSLTLFINKDGQIVNNKIFLGMLGTIPNHEYEYNFFLMQLRDIKTPQPQ